MFSGNSMLYGGPLGAYLSGIYQPTQLNNLTVPASSSMFTRRGSLRSGLPSSPTSASNSSTSPAAVSSSPFYTPQLRRKFGYSESDSYNPTSSYTSSRYLDSSSTASRPSYNTYTSSAGLPRSPSAHRYSPYSGSNSSLASSTTPAGGTGGSSEAALTLESNGAGGSHMDYKRLYESEKRANERIREEIDDTKKSLAENKMIIESLKKGANISTDKRRMERKMSEYEEEIKMHDKLKSEQEKLKAENRALTRVVARLNSAK